MNISTAQYVLQFSLFLHRLVRVQGHVLHFIRPCLPVTMQEGQVLVESEAPLRFQSMLVNASNHCFKGKMSMCLRVACVDVEEVLEQTYRWENFQRAPGRYIQKGNFLKLLQTNLTGFAFQR